jgi:hypothetical protein
MGPEKPTPEQYDNSIVDQIYQAKIEHEENGNVQYITLYYGMKELSISIEVGKNGIHRISTHIQNIGKETQRQKNETTYLYLAAKRVMEDKANELGRKISYYIQTKDEKMIAWADSTGKQIFNWSDKIPNEEYQVDTGFHHYFTFIEPTKNEAE